MTVFFSKTDCKKVNEKKNEWRVRLLFVSDKINCGLQLKITMCYFTIRNYCFRENNVKT